MAIDPAWDRLALDTATFAALIRLMKRLAPQLADVTRPLPVIDQTWQGPRRRRKNFDAPCRLPEDATPNEFARRLRAVGEGPEHALTLTRFGRSFRLEPGKVSNVVHGGQPMKI